MKKIHVTIIYFSPENNGDDDLFEFKKTLELDLPVFRCKIMIQNDSIGFLDLDNGHLVFDPERREYYFSYKMSTGIPRYGYYFPRDGYEDYRVVEIEEIFKNHDWKVKRLKED
jgi:hypothetical protein